MKPTALVVAIAVSLVACGKEQDETGTTHEPSPGSDVGSDTAADVAIDSAIVDSAMEDTAIDDVAVVDAAPCSPADVAARWAKMDADAIRLPNHAATLDLVDASGAILTLEGAEKILCPSTDLGDLSADGSRWAAWGASNEVQLNYDPTTRAAKLLYLLKGYTGVLTATDPGGHRFDIVVGDQIAQDGAPFTIPAGWRLSEASTASAFDAIYRALMSTYAPSIGPEPAGTTCVASKACGSYLFGDNAAGWYVKSLGVDLDVDRRNDPEPTPSIPTRILLTPVAP